MVLPDAAPAAAADANDAVSGFFRDGRLRAGLRVLGLGAGQAGLPAMVDSAGAMFRPSSGDAVSSDCCSDRLRKSLRTKWATRHSLARACRSEQAVSLLHSNGFALSTVHRAA